MGKTNNIATALRMLVKGIPVAFRESLQWGAQLAYAVPSKPEACLL